MTEANADRILLELHRIGATLERIERTLDKARPTLTADERYELVTPPAMPAIRICEVPDCGRACAPTDVRCRKHGGDPLACGICGNVECGGH